MKEKLLIYTKIDVSTQDELFKFLAKQAQIQKVVLRHEDFLTALYEREKVGTTGLENHIAIPHAISEKVLDQFVFVVCLKKAIKYSTLDGSDVKSVICLAVPKAQENMHLGVLQKVSIMLLDQKNQEILNTGNETKISNLFNDVRKQIKSNELDKNNKSIKKETMDIDSDEELAEQKPISLITIKKELKAEFEKTHNRDCIAKMTQNNRLINTAKQEIISLRKSLRQSYVTNKAKFKRECEQLSAKIKTVKASTKTALQSYNAKEKQEINKIKQSNSDPKIQQSALGKHYSETYKDKLAISESLTMLVAQRDALVANYKQAKNNTTSEYQAKLNLNKQMITNPKNYFYKHINKFQLALMLLLAIVGLWGIVLGSFGITINQNFMVLDVNDINIILNQIDPNGNYLEVYQVWSQHAVQSSYFTTSLCSFIFGIFALVLVVPLKFFKVSNVYLENYSKIIFGFSVMCLIVITALAASSFENIKLYQTAATFATGKVPTEGLNTQLKAYWDLKDALKQVSDFNNENDFNNYQVNVKTLLNNWTGSDAFEEANRILALENITAAIQTTMNMIIPTTTFNNIELINVVASCAIGIE